MTSYILLSSDSMNPGSCDTERPFPFQIPAEISMSIPRGCNRTEIAEMNFLHARVPIIQDLLDLRVPWALQR